MTFRPNSVLKTLAIIALCAGLAILDAKAGAEVKLPAVIGSHMVLQRDMPVPIWGTAAPNEKVTVKFRDQEKSALAGADGKWMLKLDPLKVGGPDKMTIGGVTLEDVLVGEVWVGSGQSNMDMLVGSYTKNDPALEKIAAGTYPKLRLISKGWKGWTEATPENNTRMSAMLFAFGQPLQKELDIPVGLLVGAVGGTPSGNWLSEESYRSDAACQEMVKKFAATYDFEKAKAKYEKDLTKWKEDEAAAKKDGKKPPRAPEAPVKAGECSRGKVGNLYEAHIRPFMPFGMKGVLWDQGEGGTAITGVDQYTLMGALIRGWRKEWRQGDFPFIYIQKPSGDGCAWDPNDALTSNASKFASLPGKVPGDGQYRENHIKIMSYPNTTMVISTDLGSGTHPTLKSSYGVRACRVAMGTVYGKKIEYYGPLYASQKIEGNKIRISFTHAGQGLAFKGGDKLQGFAIAGEDKNFQWADAAIDGDSIVVSSDKIAKPVAVRYGWSSKHPWANLFNKDGLPAPAFRTDQW
ncbi:MAG: hypothetical protein NTX50_08530 [Candidatus Sumerlaeota bacterium]|nr:hypothetical protein [Candidatus Sumerlaeota bacterium]